MRKNIFTFFIIYFLLLCVSVANAENGTCGLDVNWNFSDNGILTIFGSGPMEDYSTSSKIPWHDFTDSIKQVVVEEGVTTITDYAFYGCKNLSNVKLPESLISIGKDAFSTCNKLETINIPSAITIIPNWCFYGCSSLKKIDLPEKLEVIDDLAFHDCKSLTQIYIPASVRNISLNQVFVGCKNLTDIIVDSKSNNYVSDNGILFTKDYSTLISFPAGKKIVSYIVPDSVTNINDYAFYGSESLLELSITEGVKTIGSYAFAGMENLMNISFPETLLSIGKVAFHRCYNLTTLKFPSSLMSLGDDMFESCSKLSKFEVTEGSDSFITIDGVLFSADKTKLVAYPPGKKDVTYIIPSSVQVIGNYAFLFCRDLLSVSFPESLRSIEMSAFTGCNGLTSLDFPEGMLNIGERAFSTCNNLDTVIIPASMNNIGGNAFSFNGNLNSVTIKGMSTNFDKYGVFSYCGDELTIYGLPGSTAEQHALKNNIKFSQITNNDKSVLTDNVESEPNDIAGAESIFYEATISALQTQVIESLYTATPTPESMSDYEATIAVLMTQVAESAFSPTPTATSTPTMTPTPENFYEATISALQTQVAEVNIEQSVDNTETQNIALETPDTASTDIESYIVDVLINPSEQFVIKKLSELDIITGIEAATEDHDPNNRLHKQGGYTSAVYFTTTYLDPSTVYGETIIDKGTDGGGQIEVYENVTDAEKRNSYLENMDGVISLTGSHTILGSMVIRTSNKLTATQQKELEKIIIDKFMEDAMLFGQDKSSQKSENNNENHEIENSYQKPQRDGFNKDTNNIVNFGLLTISIPDYWKESKNDGNYYLAYAETGGNVAMLQMSASIDGDPVTFEILKEETENGLMSKSFSSWFDSTGPVKYDFIEINDIKGYVYTYTFIQNNPFSSGTATILCIPSVSDNKWIFISLIETDNTEYSYTDDFSKIINSLTLNSKSSTPEITSININKYGQIQLNWTMVDLDSIYEVYYSPGNITYAKLTRTSNTKLTVKSPVESGPINFKIRACNKEKCGAFSKSKSIDYPPRFSKKTPVPTPNMTSTPTPQKLFLENDIGLVKVKSDSGILLRQKTSNQSDVVRFLPNGTVVSRTKGHESGDGINWIKVKTAEGYEGYIPENAAIFSAKEMFSDLNVGDFIGLGFYEQDDNSRNGEEPIEWQILAVDIGKVLVISRHGLIPKPFDEASANISWAKCTLRSFLNHDLFDEIFSSNEKSRILLTKTENPNIKDYLFLLSEEEALKYFRNDTDRLCKPTPYAKTRGARNWVFNDYYTDWWLRSYAKNKESQSTAPCVLQNGELFFWFINDRTFVVRPAFWLDIE